MKTLWKVSSLIMILAIVSGCSLFGGSAPAPDQTPESVVKEAMTNLSKVTSGKYELSLKGDGIGAPGATPEKISFDGLMNGLFDSQDPKKPQFTMDLEGEMTADEGEAQKIDIELRVDQSNFYVNLTQLPDFGEAAPKEMLAMFTGKWWQIAIPEGALEGLPIGQTDEENMTPEQKALKELTEKTNFFKDLAFEGSKKIDGVNCFHYVGVLDKEAMKTFVVEAGKIGGEEIPESEMGNLNSLFEALNAPIDFWIDSKNMTMKKIETEVSIKPEGQGSFDMNFSFMVSDLNKEMKVEVPEGATIFDPAMLFGGMDMAGLEEMEAVEAQ
ncbi:MAG: hypothetical protein PHP74_00245 [Candidatus Gracilibacteria bacterium]|nr:hypothetical protein [Candidatus Gracilibacteria bacterium]